LEPTFIISGISALLQAVDTWVNYRDSQRAAQEFELRMARALLEPTTREQAQVLANVVPQAVLDTMGERARRCWDQYHDVLTGGYLPGEIDAATQSVKACICRELRRIRDLNGTLPLGDLTKWWEAYCSA
jgi:hypothetical protein